MTPLPFFDLGMRDGVEEHREDAVDGAGEEEEADDEGVMAGEITGEPSVASMDRRWWLWRGWLPLRSWRWLCALAADDAVGMLIEDDMAVKSERYSSVCGKEFGRVCIYCSRIEVVWCKRKSSKMGF